MPPLPASNNGQLSLGAVQALRCCPAKAPSPTQSRRCPGARGHTEMASQPWGGVESGPPFRMCGPRRHYPVHRNRKGPAHSPYFVVLHTVMSTPGCKGTMLSTSILVPCTNKVVRVWTLEPSAWVRIQTSPLLSCVTPSKSPNLSVPQFPHVYDGANDSKCLTELLQGPSNLTCAKGSKQHPRNVLAVNSDTM